MGAVIGGVATFLTAGTLAWLLVSISTPVRAWSWALVIGGVGLLGLSPWRSRLPQNRRLIPQHVALKGPAVGAFQFGFEMGTGVRTYVTAVAPYVLLPGVLLFGDLVTGTLAGVGFGLGRYAMAVSASKTSPRAWMEAFSAFEGRVDAGAFAVASLLITVVAVRGGGF